MVNCAEYLQFIVKNFSLADIFSVISTVMKGLITMAELRAMPAMRFSGKAGDIAELCCPPYDIISEEQRIGYLSRNEHNIIRLELPKGDNPYADAGAILNSWLSEEILAFDEESLYVYEEEFTDSFSIGEPRRMKIRGIIGRVKLEEFSKGIVLPHEETLSKAKDDRLNLMKATGCNFSQIYSLYRDEQGTTRARMKQIAENEPLQSFTDTDGITHRLWRCSDAEMIAAISNDFAERKLYIADGHHRYETGINYRNWRREQGIAQPGDACDYIMMMLVDMEDDGLLVLPTHRLVRDLEQFDADVLCEKASELFDVEAVSGGADEVNTILNSRYTEGKHAFALYCSGWRVLTLRSSDVMKELMPEASDALRGLDVSILHTLVLERLMGIDKANMAAQKNLVYTRDFAEAVDGVDSGKFQCAFILNPTRVSEIRDVAVAGEKMPQKSTYFYPKLITGMVMNRLAEDK